ncbi:F-box domain containing protein [Parasponia andersonii]|uniref:F-box domain containing protein n=1 Tax=Parasponia andersonii TaxID=3476 RepID=A0A2P5DR87_PARAD|nr:F-box domain containing protein [Parasponia andersonii]
MRFYRENHLGAQESTGSMLIKNVSQQEKEEEEDDYFDHLPDAILLVIFNKILDAKSLVRCRSVSKRFNSLIPQVEAICLPLLRKIPPRKPTSNTLSAKHFKNLLNNFIPKSIRFLHRIVSINKPRPKNARNLLYYSPNEALEGFKEMKSLHLELPCPNGEVGLAGNDESFVKWKAEFGTNLQSCVILGANSIQREKLPKNDNLNKESGNRNCESAQPVLTDQELKTRIVWMISSLIAASARHYLLKRIIAEFPDLRNVVISDENKRGKLYMGEEQLAELRSNSGNNESSVALESSLERSVIPDLGMKLWYVPQLELPGSGCVIKGATLVVIKPLDHELINGKKGAMDDGDLLGNGFDGNEEENAILGEAVREMIKLKKTYVMEMTSF